MTKETELPAVKVKAEKNIPADIKLKADVARLIDGEAWKAMNDGRAELPGSLWHLRQGWALEKAEQAISLVSASMSALTLKDDPGNGADGEAVRAAALEEAAKLIQATADEHSTKGRDLRGGYSDRRFYAVMGARLNESAAAIRALIPREG
jgi:hypothetical protein